MRTQQWLDVAIRPDLHAEPAQRDDSGPSRAPAAPAPASVSSGGSGPVRGRVASEAIHGQGNDGPQQEAPVPPGHATAAALTVKEEQVTTVIPAGGTPATRTGGPGASSSDSETTAFGIVAPGGAPAVVAGGGVNTCTPSTARAALAWDVVEDGDNWKVDVTSLTLAGTIKITDWPSQPNAMTVPNTPSPVDGGNIHDTAGSPNHWQAVIDDMADYDTAGAGGAGPNWHSTAASRAHEWAHWNEDYIDDAVTSAAGGNWAQANQDLDALVEPKASSATQAEARTALQPRVDARLTTWRNATIARWNAVIGSTDRPGAGGKGYAAGAAVLSGLIAAVRTYATNKGWNGGGGAPGGGAPGGGAAGGGAAP